MTSPMTSPAQHDRFALLDGSKELVLPGTAAVGLHWGAETALTHPEALSTLSQRLGHMPGVGIPTLKA